MRAGQGAPAQAKSGLPGGIGVRLPHGAIELPGGGRALFSDRSHGNVSSVGGEGAEGGFGARERLRERCGVDVLLRGYQVHGAVVGRVYADGARLGTPAGKDDLADARCWRDGEAQPGFRADGHAVAAPGVAAMVLAADCLPIVLGAQGAVAAVHAGWRGVAAGVLEQGVRALREVGGTGEIVAVVGPCAGACCYEVGEEVHAVFGGAHRSGALIDLRAIAHDRLGAAGVADVLDVSACTVCDERFFSHRREGPRAGRQAALAWLPRPSLGSIAS
ncbi:MAG TPA: polyphenol oxidase family protein [Solirubrobacteraceae bacterium]|nr:polyphenol oxidase family protein [Solirubrobacteraceae bacterium]